MTSMGGGPRARLVNLVRRALLDTLRPPRGARLSEVLVMRFSRACATACTEAEREGIGEGSMPEWLDFRALWEGWEVGTAIVRPAGAPAVAAPAARAP